MPIDPPSSPLPPLSNAPVANPVSPLPVYVPSVSEPQTSLPTFVPAASAPQTALPVPPAQAYGIGGSLLVPTTDPRLADAREWTAETIAQTEAEAGAATTRRAWTAQRVRQAIVAWWNSLSVGFRNFASNPTSGNLALLLTDENGVGGGFVRAEGATLTNVNLVGPVNLTGQDASTGSRLMNRDLIAPEITQGMWIPLSWNAPTGTANTSSSNAGIGFSLGLQGSVAVAGNHRVCSVFRNPLNRAGSGANMVFSQAKWSMLTSMQTNGISNCQYRLLVGVVAGSIELNAAGVAVVWTGSGTVRLQIHNGSTILESSDFPVQNIGGDRLHRFLVNFNGSTLRLFAQSFGDNAALPRWSFVGELSRAELPNNSSGTSITWASVATGTPVFQTTLNIDAMFFAPYVVNA
jgi:hypothetical protein